MKAVNKPFATAEMVELARALLADMKAKGLARISTTGADGSRVFAEPVADGVRLEVWLPPKERPAMPPPRLPIYEPALAPVEAPFPAPPNCARVPFLRILPGGRR